MKKTLYIPLAFAALLLAGCQPGLQSYDEGSCSVCFLPSVCVATGSAQLKSTELVSEDGALSLPLHCEVGDGMDAAPQTRAAQLNTTGDPGDLEDYIDMFHVSAWLDGQRFIPAPGAPRYDEVTFGSNGLWRTEENYRWNPAKVATFYAYANLPVRQPGLLEASVSCSNAGSQTLNYSVVPDKAEDQKDILMGFFQGKGRYDETLATGGIADILFYHPLAAVRFRLWDGATNVSVKQIRIRGVYSSGVAEMTVSTAAKPSNADKFIWTPGGDMKTVMLGDGSSSLAVDPEGIIGVPFILIPQDLGASKVVITVVLDINGSGTVFEAVDDSNNWVAGKTYTYALEL